MKYKRIVLKLSGEKLTNKDKSSIDFDSVISICKEIIDLKNLGYEIAIVVGGGNIWRGRYHKNMDRCTADHIGMLATTMNALALKDGFEQLGTDVRIMTGIEMRQIAEFYIKDRAIKHLEKNRIVVFGCGTGSPFFSTDTAAALRAAEIQADIIFKCTNVDGVYSADPKLDPNAIKYDEITYDEVLKKNLKVMDSPAIALCRDNNIPLLVFELKNTENIVRAAKGENIGTIVK